MSASRSISEHIRIWIGFHSFLNRHQRICLRLSLRMNYTTKLRMSFENNQHYQHLVRTWYGTGHRTSNTVHFRKCLQMTSSKPGMERAIERVTLWPFDYLSNVAHSDIGTKLVWALINDLMVLCPSTKLSLSLYNSHQSVLDTEFTNLKTNKDISCYSYQMLTR